jgi:hypothetical protein
MKLRQSILLAALASFAITLTGCGGGSSTPPPPATVTVTITSAPSSPLTTGTTASVTATTSNSSSVNWTVSCSVSSCGSFSSASTASGVATTYTAPSAPTTVTITATSGSASASTPPITVATPAPPPITVAFSPAPPSSLTTGTTASLTAVVTNDSKNAGVTWTCASSPCGSFSSTTTASGTATTYTAPSAVPTSGTVTVTATSVTDTTKSVTATINITAPAAITVALNPTPPASLIVDATASLTAIVSNDSQSKGVTWTATCSLTPCGSFSSASTASGTATVYTAPTTVPSPNTVTITATSVTDTTKSASATITISAILADGTYVYHFSGWDSTGPSFFAGAFTVSGGVITGGEQDFSDASTGYALNTLTAANCSLSAAGNNIQVVLGTSNTALGVNGIETLRGTVVSSSRVLISEFDTFGTGNGSIDLQTTPVAAPTGGYAFVVSGWDINNTTSPATVTPLAFGGILNFNGTSLSIGNSVFDYNLGAYGTTNGPAIGQDQLFTSGTLNGPDSFGRVSISLVPTSSSGVPGFILTGYVVSPSQIQLVESQADTLLDDLGGVALGQAASAQFSLSSLAGTTYVFASSGEDVAGLATFGGNLSFSTSGAISGTLAVNDGTNVATGTNITAGSYTVDPTGRATLSTIQTSQFGTSVAFAFQLYLDGNGNALQMGADVLEVATGPAYLKTAAASNDFEGPYALSGSGILNDTNLDAWGAVGPVTLTSDNLTGAADYNAQGTTPVSATTVTATENNATPSTLTVVGLDSTSFTSSRLYSYFPIDGKRVLAVETDGNQLGILRLESTSH